MTAPMQPGQLPTRQQLDEIDALLRRMLSLPSMTHEPEPTLPATSFGSTPAVREVAPQQPPTSSEPIIRSWRVDWPQTPPPASQPPPAAAWGTPVSAPVQHTPWVPPTPPTATSLGPQVPFALPVHSNGAHLLPVATTVPSSFVAPATGEKTTSLFVLALLLLNGTFNFFTYLLGPLGTWLRGSGRGSLGWLGILMVLGSAVWAFGNWYGYEWPKIPLDRLRIPQ
ncbi:MAG: hypothetical protein EXS09_14355 [Gemmataceae bacterium]|nr:hypothetical protein [Gemmataceae bacterium]